MPLRVRFSETDAMGVANNAAYLAWFEVGRVEYLREIGHSYADVHSGGMDMVVVEARVATCAPLRFDDTFTVECTCTSVRGATFTFGYELRDDAGRVHARRDPPRLRRPGARCGPCGCPSGSCSAVTGRRRGLGAVPGAAAVV